LTELKKGVKLMHHVLPTYFKTVFGFQLNLSSKLPPLVENFSLLLVKYPLFNKSIYISNGKVFQNSLNISSFSNESNFNSFLKFNFIQKLFMKLFKNKSSCTRYDKTPSKK